MDTKHLLLLFLFLSQITFGQSFQCKSIDIQVAASFRGLSIVDDSLAWVSGTKGWMGRSTNGGKKWDFQQVKGFEQYDFRSLYAFDAQTAVIANAGSPAYILYTRDAGSTWKVVYTNQQAEAFFDGIDFWNKNEGIIYGDPIEGRMLLLRTRDGGQNWQELPPSSRPALSKGEASFAASGTAIQCLGKQKLVIATGGTVSRLLVSTDQGNSWGAIQTPIMQGQASTGIFSVAYLNEKQAIIVGGDYKRDSLATDHIFYTQDNGQHWLAPAIPTRGYRECVTYLSKTTVIATGPTGTDISYDGGIHWQAFSDEKSFHAVRKSRQGKLIMMVGNGKISLVQPVDR